MLRILCHARGRLDPVSRVSRLSFRIEMGVEVACLTPGIELQGGRNTKTRAGDRAGNEYHEDRGDDDDSDFVPDDENYGTSRSKY
jgi:hypothetical protein